MTPNLSEDNRLKDSESIKIYHLNTVVCVPVIATEKVIGILYVDSGNLFEEITQEDTAFTAAVANELALTVSNLAHNIKNLNMLNQNAVDLMQIHLDRIEDEKADKCWKIIGQSISRINELSMEMAGIRRRSAPGNHSHGHQPGDPVQCCGLDSEFEKQVC